MSKATSPKPPRCLGTRGRRFWRSVLAEFDLTDAEQELLTEACRTLDTIEVLEGQVALDGATVAGSKGQTVLHPAIGEARQQRLTLSRLLAQLELPDENATGQVLPSAASLRGRKAAESRWAVHSARTRPEQGGRRGATA